MMTELLAEKKPRIGMFARAYEFVTGRPLPERSYTHNLGGSWVLFGKKDLEFKLPRNLKLITSTPRRLRIDTKEDLRRAIAGAQGMVFEGAGVVLHVPRRRRGDWQTTIGHEDPVLPRLVQWFFESHDSHIMARSQGDGAGFHVVHKDKVTRVTQMRLKSNTNRSVGFHPYRSHEGKKNQGERRQKNVRIGSDTRPVVGHDHSRTLSFTMPVELSGD